MPIQLDRIVESLDRFAKENAFCINDRFHTYSDLKKSISSIQKLLKDENAAKKSNIGILIYDDIETYASVFAILFSGCSFVPINPLHPQSRNQSIIDQAEIKILLSSTNDDNAKRFASKETRIVSTKTNTQEDGTFYYEKLSDDQTAYILFTSGSTGFPKGVPLTVNNLNSFLDAFFALGYEVDHLDRFIQMFDMAFDLSIMSYMAPLCIGACVYTVPVDGIKSMQVYQLMEKYELTFVLLVPSILTHLRSYFLEINLEKMRYTLFCGEALYEDLTMEWSQCVPNAKVQNVYGPTEATIFCMTYDVNRNQKNKSLNGILSIGKSMKNMGSIIVDENFKPRPANEKGELCLTGAQVTPGYLKNETKNKEAFFKSNGKTYYRTGDLCFYDDSGDFFYSGRIDFQVKVQGGFRVELSEIEHHAREFLKSYAVVAHAKPNEIGISQIFLFVEDFPKDFEALQTYLKTKLPDYMMPAKVFNVKIFPLNSNGKVDRKALVQTMV